MGGGRVLPEKRVGRPFVAPPKQMVMAVKMADFPLPLRPPKKLIFLPNGMVIWT